jgi:hypothetical protein
MLLKSSLTMTRVHTIEVDGLGRIEVVFIPKCYFRLLWGQRLIERVLLMDRLLVLGHVTILPIRRPTIDKMTTHGKFREATIAIASEVFPEPELPATPIMLAFPHGGS